MASSDLRIEIARSALGEWASLEPRELRQAVGDAVEALASEPRPRGCLQLVGRPEYRIGVEGAIVTYAVGAETRTLTVLRVRPPRR